MKVWALGDTHLYFGTPDKNMSLFGDKWRDHPKKIEEAWRQHIADEDLVLIPGDISWGKQKDEAMPDLYWIDRLPGLKIISKGNHDYWWPSNKQLKELLPPSIRFVNKTALDIGPYSIAGTRLWDHRGVDFSPFIQFRFNPKATHPGPKTEEEKAHDERIYQSELERLELALKALNPSKIKIAMVHYPPLNERFEPTPASTLLERYNVDTCIFGHIHNIKEGVHLFDQKHNGVRYVLTSCDYLHFKPTLLYTDSL
ncbi:MAG: metallophosphoesterase [Simkaniaceae bacterium]|nr:metallophosphoesterase [Simkaniaceae bacterium]